MRKPTMVCQVVHENDNLEFKAYYMTNWFLTLVRRENDRSQFKTYYMPDSCLFLILRTMHEKGSSGFKAYYMTNWCLILVRRAIFEKVCSEFKAWYMTDTGLSFWHAEQCMKRRALKLKPLIWRTQEFSMTGWPVHVAERFQFKAWYMNDSDL